MRTAASLIEPVSDSTTGGEVYDRFHAEPETLAIAVVDADMRPIGIIERNAFFLRMAAEFGRALFGKRPITALMDDRPLIVEATTPVSGFLADAIHTSGSALLGGFIVVEDGRYLGIGTALNLLVAANDENQRRAAEMEALAQSFRLLFDDNAVPMHVFDRETRRILRVNEAAVSQFGRSREMLLQAAITDFIAPEQREASIARLSRPAAPRETDPYTIIDGHGRRRQVQSYLRPLEFDGVKAFLSATVDVSDRLHALEAAAESRDAAQAANRAKSEFLANMSHEIRTPLNGVLGIAHSLNRTPLSPHQKDMVRLIEGSAETLQVLLSDILDLARVEAGRLEIAAEPFALDEAVSDIAELFRAKADEKALAFDIDCAALAGLCVVGDRTRIKQILGNLISNAVKFTAEGQVRLTATDVEADAERLRVRFEVADTGIGFDEETRLRLFNRFEQADGSGVRKFGGAGLGLAISRTLAIAMGGELSARSTPGAGSTFVFELCLPIAQAQTTPRQAAPAETFDRPMRILLAEDHPINRKVVELMFEGLSVDLVCAEDGVLAVDAFTRQAFDVILMDMQMPNMDGLQATRAIRSHEREHGRQPTPVIMLSANALPEHKAAGHAAGADLYLTKPIIAGELFAAIDVALAGLDAQAAA